MTKKKMVKEIQELEKGLYELYMEAELNYIKSKYPFGCGEKAVLLEPIEDIELVRIRHEWISVNFLLFVLRLPNIKSEKESYYKKQARNWVDGIK